MTPHYYQAFAEKACKKATAFYFFVELMILTSLQNCSSATICTTFVTKRDPDR